MAFEIDNDDVKLKLVAWVDSVVKCSREDYMKYLDSLDEKLLKLEGDPTYFVFNKQLDYKAHRKLLKAQAAINEGGQVDFDLSSVLEEVRFHLCDIHNPPNMDQKKILPFVRDSDGYCSGKIVGALQGKGVAMDFYKVLKSENEKSDSVIAKKN